MINIAIVDDDVKFIDILKSKLLNLDNNLNIYCYTKPYEFIDNIDNIDYVLLDIGLPQVDGITLSKKLRNNNISIFFITSYKELMIKAFGKNVEGFILKENIDDGIDNFLKFIYQFKEENSILIPTMNKKVKLYFDEIVYINYSLRDLEYYLSDNKKIVQKNKTIKDILSELTNDFILINRTTIININYVDSFKNDYLFIRNNKFKVSRRKVKQVKILLFERGFNSDSRIMF